MFCVIYYYKQYYNNPNPNVFALAIHIQEVWEKEEMVDLTETGDKAKAEEVEEVASEETEAVAEVEEEEKIAQAGTKSR